MRNFTKDDARVQRAVGVCRKIVVMFFHSWKKKRDSAKAQGDMDLPLHSLVSDSATRRGSQQKMMERVLEQEASIRAVLSGDRKSVHLVPTWQDIDIQAALAPLIDFTDMLSG